MIYLLVVFEINFAFDLVLKKTLFKKKVFILFLSIFELFSNWKLFKFEFNLQFHYKFKVYFWKEICNSKPFVSFLSTFKLVFDVSMLHVWMFRCSKFRCLKFECLNVQHIDVKDCFRCLTSECLYDGHSFDV
jgi:hypothetical protein